MFLFSSCPSRNSSVLPLHLAAANPLVLLRVFPAHQRPVSGPLPTLPETPSLTTNDAASTETASVDTVVLLPAAPSADHPVCPLVDMVLSIVVAFVACVDFVAAGEAEPAMRPLVVSANATIRKRLSSMDA